MWIDVAAQYVHIASSVLENECTHVRVRNGG